MVLRLSSDAHAALPPPAWAVNSHFPVFLHNESRKTGNCSFTATLVGGIPDFLVFSAQSGGKLAIAALPPLS
ncbi:hypothetical protein AAC387_Pa04g0786 [Persea americana]